jgi:thioredoxin reductase (NADPH)
MIKVLVIGDGPGGLSAALLLAKNGVEVVVYGQDKTGMHSALLKNYLGVDDMHGSTFQGNARRQVKAHGAILKDERVETLAATDDGYELETESGETDSAPYVILSEGKGARLAKALGLENDASTGIVVDRNGHSNLDGVYVVGRSVRPGRSQAIISAGDGAAAAIDILSREKGEPFADWDSPPKD